MATTMNDPFVLVWMTSDICGNVTAQSRRIGWVGETREECEDAVDRYFDRPRSGYHAFRICRRSDLDRREKGRATRWLARREPTTV